MSLVTSYFAIVLYSAAYGLISTPPIDTEAITNRTVNFSCTVDSNSNKIEWHHAPVGVAAAKTVYALGTVYNSYKYRVNVTCLGPELKCILTIGKVSAVDAGRYICVEGISRAAAELSVFDIVPSSESCHVRSTSSSDLIIGKNDCGLKEDIITISCSFKYFGNKSPFMVWTDQKQTIIPPDSPVFKDNITTSSVRLTASVNRRITCSIRYSGSYPSSRFNWSTTIQVETFLNTSTVQYASCSSPAITCSHQYHHHQCEIRWKRENGSAVSDEILKLPSGIYLCVADCIVRYKPCVVQQLKVIHDCALDWSTVDGQTSSTGDSTAAVAAAISAGVLLIIGGLILIFFFRKKNKSELCCRKTILNTNAAVGGTEQVGIPDVPTNPSDGGVNKPDQKRIESSSEDSRNRDIEDEEDQPTSQSRTSKDKEEKPQDKVESETDALLHK